MLDARQVLLEGLFVGAPLVHIVVGLGLLGDELAVDSQLLVQVGHLVARQAHHALDVVDARVHRVVEHHHVAARGVVVGDDLLVDHRQADAVVELVDQDQVAHLQRRDHRAGRDLERLEQEAAQHEHDGDDREQPRGPVEPPRLLQQAAFDVLDIAVDPGDPLARQLGAAGGVLRLVQRRRLAPPGCEVQALGEPVREGDERQEQQQQREVADPLVHQPAAEIDHQGRI